MASNAQHQEIKAALERYSKEELVDLMEHLLRIYVLNEPVKLDSAVSKPETLRDLAGCTFKQILSQLQTSLELDELGKFRVTPYTTYVSIGEMEFDLNGPTPTLAREAAPSASESEDSEEEMSPAERMDNLDNKPWRSAPRPVQEVVSKVETPTMADLFADDRPIDRDRSFLMFDEAPERAEDPDEPPPIADVAPGDDPEVVNSSSTNDFAKAAASREEAPEPAKQAPPPPLAEGDKQIDPSNRFAMLDLD
ncbi:MAG: hypothetical protein IJM59_10920 [Proteobacteria bacterium]|nr:hypothetical protein [Pseudomonadota bacterium]